MNGHTRLVKQNTTYYVRARISSALTYLTKSVQFNYSLQTHNYYEALAKVRRESYKIDLKINLLKVLDMKIRKGELLLDDVDIDKLVIHKLKTIEKLFEDHYDEIADGSFDLQTSKVFSAEKINEAKQQCHKREEMPELKCVELFIREYFSDLKKDKRSPFQTIKMIGRLDTEDIKIITNHEKTSQWVVNTKKVLKGIDTYIDRNTNAIQNNENVSGINPRVKRCIEAIALEKTLKPLKPPTLKLLGKESLRTLLKRNATTKSVITPLMKISYALLLR